MRTPARQTRANRTIPVDLHHAATSVRLRAHGKACVACVLALLRALGLQRPPTATCRGGGCLTRHAPSARVRLGGLTLWRVQGTTGQAGFTGLPHCGIRDRQRRPEVARDARLAPHGGRSWARGAGIWPLSPMARSRLVCALGHPSLVTGRTRCGRPLPRSGLADEKHRRGRTATVSLPTMVRGRVRSHLGSPTDARAAAWAPSAGAWQRAALPPEPS